MSEDSKTIIKHEWLQVLVMTITVAGLFLWTRSESKADYRHMETHTDTHLQAIRAEIRDFNQKWMDETKDFHGRLCAIEESRRK